jgi:glycerophosphoryl diester phosphodiesterase
MCESAPGIKTNATALRRARRCSLILSAALVIAGVVAERAHSVEIIAHRGASYSAPENTLAAVNLAWQRDADAVETDIWLSRDGRIVVLHDETTERTAGRKWKVAGRTLAELRGLDAGSWKGREWAGEKIPTLEEILATVPDGKRLLIEIKCGPAILPELERVLSASGKQPSQTVVISFDLDTVREAKARMPELPVYWIQGTSPSRNAKTGEVVAPPAELVEKCRRAGLDGLDLKYDSRLTRDIVEAMHSLGLRLYVWTVDEPADAARLTALGVDGITTDRPGWLRGQLHTAE